MARLVHILLCTIFFSTVVLAQETIGTQEVILPSKQLSLDQLFKAIENQTDYFISYNTRQIKLSSTVTFAESKVQLNTILEVLEEESKVYIELDKVSNKIIILPPKHNIIYGIIRDSSSLETLTGVTLVGKNNKGTSTNQDGFFYLKVPSQTDSVFISYLGYKTQVIILNGISEEEALIHLVSDNILPDIIIEANTFIPEQSTFNPKNIAIDKTSPIKGIGGRSDLISTLRHTSGVSVGSEAQSGFTVRGGGPDQNLVLLDGLPVYETSHLGGLSSIFVDNVTKKADLWKGGIPARYGGKLSSVLDIRLKEGHRHKFRREAMVNLENFSGFLEGPIGKNTSFIFNGRASLLNHYSAPILKRYFDFVDSELKYYDVYTKLTHWFKPSNRLSLSIFSGDDKIFLRRNEASPNFSFTDSNKITWNNTLVAINWNTAVNNKIFFHGTLGRSDFGFNSKSANKVNTSIDSSSLTIDVSSRQRDYTGKFDFDFYTDNFGTFKIGGGMILHESAPSILEERSIDAITNSQDSVYYSDERYLYIESNIRMGKHWKLSSGIRYNAYFGLDSTYQYLQPRANLNYVSDQWQFNLAYSRMSQFLHLLVNPSSGLPSDLWVPSTKKVEPQLSQLGSISFNFRPKEGFKFGIEGFYSHYSNLIEYSNPYEIIQVLVENHVSFNTDIRDVNWEDRVSNGKGRAYGLELDLSYSGDLLTLGLAYTLSRSERTFNFGIYSEKEEITFPYKYDRPHNIAINGKINLKKKKNINFEWLFGNGNNWTLAENAIPDGQGGILYDPRGVRNNERLSSYHRLGVSYSSEKKFTSTGKLFYTVGIYNLYNNQNPFYSFIETRPTQNPPFQEIEISLYPIFPQINIGYTW